MPNSDWSRSPIGPLSAVQASGPAERGDAHTEVTIQCCNYSAVQRTSAALLHSQWLPVSAVRVIMTGYPSISPPKGVNKGMDGV